MMWKYEKHFNTQKCLTQFQALQIMKQENIYKFYVLYEIFIKSLSNNASHTYTIKYELVMK